MTHNLGGGTEARAIGAGEEYADLTCQDDVESRAIDDLLEQETVPLFYTRSSDGLSRAAGFCEGPQGRRAFRDAAE
jgi:hypothetical protein